MVAIPFIVDAAAGLVRRQELSTPSPSQIRLATEMKSVLERNSTAPEYFGSILGWLFFGFVGMQFYTYVANRPRDPAWLKVLVYFVMLLISIQVGFETYSGYESLVAGWGDYTLLKKPPRFLILEPFFDAVLALCVQNFYVWRIWAFQRSILAKVFCVVITSLSVISTAGGIAIPGIFFNIDVQARLVPETRIYNLLWLTCGVVIDVLISLSMTIILRDAQSRTIAQSTKITLGKLIRLTVQTGALTAFLAIAILILFLFQEKIGLLQTLAGYLLGKSYALSLLANLNLRIAHRTNLSRTELSTNPGSIHFERNKNSTGYMSRRNSKFQGLSFLSTRDVGFSDPRFASDGTSTRTTDYRLSPVSPVLPVIISKHTEQFREVDTSTGISERYSREMLDTESTLRLPVEGSDRNLKLKKTQPAIAY